MGVLKTNFKRSLRIEDRVSGSLSTDNTSFQTTGLQPDECQVSPRQPRSHGLSSKKGLSCTYRTFRAPGELTSVRCQLEGRHSWHPGLVSLPHSTAFMSTRFRRVADHPVLLPEVNVQEFRSPSFGNILPRAEGLHMEGCEKWG